MTGPAVLQDWFLLSDAFFMRVDACQDPRVDTKEIEGSKTGPRVREVSAPPAVWSNPGICLLAETTSALLGAQGYSTNIVSGKIGWMCVTPVLQWYLAEVDL